MSSVNGPLKVVYGVETPVAVLLQTGTKLLEVGDRVRLTAKAQCEPIYNEQAHGIVVRVTPRSLGRWSVLVDWVTPPHDAFTRDPITIDASALELVNHPCAWDRMANDDWL